MALFAREYQPIEKCPFCGGRHEYRLLALELDPDTQEMLQQEFAPCDMQHELKRVVYTGVYFSGRSDPMPDVPGVIKSKPFTFVSTTKLRSGDD